jgi:hypothetical protein
MHSYSEKWLDQHLLFYYGWKIYNGKIKYFNLIVSEHLHLKANWVIFEFIVSDCLYFKAKWVIFEFVVGECLYFKAKWVTFYILKLSE